MSHRITQEEAIEKYNKEKEIQQLIKEGKPYKSSRRQHKKQQRETRIQAFVSLLRRRGGYAPDKAKEKEKIKNVDSGNNP